MLLKVDSSTPCKTAPKKNTTLLNIGRNIQNTSSITHHMSNMMRVTRERFCLQLSDLLH